MGKLAYAMSQSPQNIPGRPGPSPLAGLLPIFLIFGIFYFLLIRPQQTQQKKHQEMLSRLSKNDEVVTSGGIHGTVVNVDNETVTLRLDDSARVKFQKSAISYVKKRTT